MATATAAQAPVVKRKPHSQPQQQQLPTYSPIQVAWAFVKKYYTYVNKDPGTLPNFYGANSVLIHGVEGEVTEESQGLQEIEQKYSEMKFDNCRVLVTNVDCSPSIDGSIFIQVLGELTNRGEPAHKFAQSFLLAKQPNGYYIMNDIFRYLKDEIDSDYEEEDEAEESVKSTAIPEPAQPLPFEPEPVLPEPELHALAPRQAQPQRPHQVAEREIPREAEPVPAYAEHARPSTPEVQGNGMAKPSRVTQQREIETDATDEVPTVSQAPAREPSPTPDVATHANPPVSQLLSAETKPVPQPEAPAPGPAAPSTWARIASHEANKWKKEAVPDAKGTRVKPAAASRPAVPQAPLAHVTERPDVMHPAPSQGNHGNHGHRDAKDKPRSYDPNASIYVKHVPSDVTPATIISAFATFGEVLHCEFNSFNNGAFVDFATVEAAAAALQQVEVPLPTGATVIAQEKRPKNSRPASRGSYSGGRGGGYHSEQGSSGRGGGYHSEQGSSGRGGGYHGEQNTGRGGRGRGRGRGDSRPSRGAHPAGVAAK